ncbi:hypothetical protein JKF63_01541 [Porcisia hertigi]|uniref:Protein phosphatase 1 regulatory subunit 7 n=1 Tax=Porcisia hertigi TaxID=2761500 RepID=A0A836HGR2_9TRYP|nr:hypothetical protein JKF63_01541 [Porcisia hertigi]
MSAPTETFPGATSDSNATSVCPSRAATLAGHSPQFSVSSAQVELLRQKLSSVLLYQPDLQDLLSLCAESNAWTVEEATLQPHTITTIELFLLQIPRMPLLQCFPYLVTVKFMNIGLESIADFAPLAHVEELWLSENHIRVIEGLDNMTRLRRLYLHNNRIESLNGLPPLRHLRELWLSSNRLSALTHLTPLRKLRVLYVSGNPLENLDDAFSKDMSHLNELNLSGCHLSSITDLYHLQQLSCLRNLWLLDPLFGDNPICRLHNYETLTLAMLGSLESLDGSFVTHEQRSLVESVLHKKRSYYAMRARILETQITLLARHAEACAVRHIKDYSKALLELRSCLQPVKHELAERALYHPDDKHGAGGSIGLLLCRTKSDKSTATRNSDDSSTTPPPVPTATLEELNRQLSLAIDTCEVQGRTVMLRLFEATQEAKAQSQVLKERFAVELHTAGNVRLETLSPDHEAYLGAVEMVQERFDHGLFAERFGIAKVEVTRVRRTINRGLRLRFDDRVKELRVDLANPQLRNRFVGLFGIVPVTSQGQSACLQHVLVRGTAARFSASSEDGKNNAVHQADSMSYRPVPAEEGVPLTNSLFYADEERLLSCCPSTGGASRNAGALSSGSEPSTWCRGQVVLYRVYLGKTVHALGGGGAVSSSSPPLSFLQQNGRVKRKDYSADTCAAYRLLPSTPAGDSGSSNSQPLPSSYMWYCFDRALLLPDCVVDYMYSVKEAPLTRSLKTPVLPGTMALKMNREAALALLNGLPPSLEWWETKSADADDTQKSRMRTDGIEDVLQCSEALLDFIHWCGPPGKQTRSRGTASYRNTLQQVAELETNNALACVQKTLGKDCMAFLLRSTTIDKGIGVSEDHSRDPSNGNMEIPLQAQHVEEYAAQISVNKTPLTLCVLRSRGITTVLQDFATPLCAHITTLDLAHNRLASVSWFALSKEAPQLQLLNLSGNVLSHLHLDGSRFPSLHTLDLSDNKLENVTDFATIRSAAAALEELFVHGNPFLWRADGQEAEARLWLYLLPPPTSMMSRAPGVKPAVVKLNTHPIGTYPGTLAAQRYRRACLLPGGRATSRMACITACLLQCVKRDTERCCASASVFSIDGVTGPESVFEQVIRQLERLMVAGDLEAYLQKDHTLKASLDEASHPSSPDGVLGDIHPPLSPVAPPCLNECDTFRWSGGLLDDASGLVDLLPNLCHLTLRGQALTNASPLLHLHRLETLNLAENHLTELPCLAELKALRELVLDFNELTSLPSTMGPLPALRILSASGNKITQVDATLFLNSSSVLDTLKSRTPSPPTPQLEALYLSYNCIADMNTIYALRDVLSLLILNVAGNPCAAFHGAGQEEEEVRLYLIHAFPQLRILDGVSISAAEMSKAREVYAGKINADLLTERACGPQETWASLRVLNLSHCSLKEVNLIEPFVALEVLHLQHNMLTSALGVGMLTQLTALDLSHNRLGGAPWRNVVGSASNANGSRGPPTAGPMTPPPALGDALVHLRRLQSLSLEANQITDLSALKLRFPHLKFLNMRGNELQHIQRGLVNLPELHELLLDQNKLRAFGTDSFLANTKLTILSAENNLLRSTEGLQQCRSLEQLKLGANRLADLNLLMTDLQYCPIKVAVFVGNPVARKTNYRASVIMRFTLLGELDRRVVTQEERDKAVSARMTELVVPPNVVIDINCLSGVGAVPGGSFVLPPQSGMNLNSLGGSVVSGAIGLPSRGRGGGVPVTQSPPQSHLASIRASVPSTKRAVAADRFAVHQRTRTYRR